MKAKDVIFQPVHEKCKGCSRVLSSKGRLGYAKCAVYFNPSAWWQFGFRICPLATHLALWSETPLMRHRIGQQKQRRKAR